MAFLCASFENSLNPRTGLGLSTNNRWNILTFFHSYTYNLNEQNWQTKKITTGCKHIAVGVYSQDSVVFFLISLSVTLSRIGDAPELSRYVLYRCKLPCLLSIRTTLAGSLFAPSRLIIACITTWAARSIGNPNTPVLIGGIAIDLNPSISSWSKQLVTQFLSSCSQFKADELRHLGPTAWITLLHGRFPGEVVITSPATREGRPAFLKYCLHSSPMLGPPIKNIITWCILSYSPELVTGIYGQNC